MAHSHSHSHARESNIALVFFLNFAFMLIEIVGGFWTNSIAIISDAIHDSGDTMALGLSWYLERVSRRKRDSVFSFGYRRFSLLAALINGVVLLGGTAFILIKSIPRLLDPEPLHIDGMLALAVLGIVVNSLAALRLRKGRSMNESVLTLHLVEDILGWVAVLIIAVVMRFVDVPILDPLLALIFAAVILWNAFGRLKKTFMIFLQSIPDDVDVAGIEKTILGCHGIADVHDTHVWSLDGQHHVLSTHIVVDKRLTLEEIDQIKSVIREKLQRFDIQHATIEVDYEGLSCEFVNHEFGAH